MDIAVSSVFMAHAYAEAIHHTMIELEKRIISPPSKLHEIQYIKLIISQEAMHIRKNVCGRVSY
jgi:hypothetical protein